MLFIIEEDVVNANDTNFLKCFENLLLGYIEGNHLLFIKPKVVDLITNTYENSMDDRMKNQFIHYQEEFMMESKIAYKLVNYAIKIVPDSVQEQTLNLDDNHKLGYLHTKSFLTSSTVQKCILLGENPDDGDIYKIFAQAYINSEDSSLTTQLKIENGGGSTTSPTFKRKVLLKEELCLCILDSDKKFPSDLSTGETAKRVIRENKSLLTPKTTFYIENRCRELENMLPLHFYHNQYFSDAQKKPIFEDFKRLNELDDKLVFYFDMKKGVKHYDTRNYGDWCNLPRLLHYKRVTTCQKDLFCDKKDNCKHILIKSFGSKILEHFISYYKSITSKEIQFSIKNSPIELQNIWNDIGKMVFSWGCGQDQILANT